jgi:hypothetical protein
LSEGGERVEWRRERRDRSSGAQRFEEGAATNWLGGFDRRSLVLGGGAAGLGGLDGLAGALPEIDAAVLRVVVDGFQFGVGEGQFLQGVEGVV